MKQPKHITEQMLCEAMNKRLQNMIFRLSVANSLANVGATETDFSTLTVEEVIEKIRDFLNSEPSDENYEIFLRYLASYPVSMCKRNISPLLQFMIGFHYRLGKPNGEFADNGVKAISYDELAQIFERSKATISECVNKTEDSWKNYQEEARKEARGIAMEQLIEEEKQKLKLEQNKPNIQPKNEQTTKIPEREDNIP